MKKTQIRSEFVEHITTTLMGECKGADEFLVGLYNAMSHNDFALSFSDDLLNALEAEIAEGTEEVPASDVNLEFAEFVDEESY